MKKRILFISSMGGHLNELLQLDSIFSKYDYLLVTEENESTKFLKDTYKNVEYLKYGTKKDLLKYFYIFFSNIVRSFKIIFKFKPQIIITTGTHTAVPSCYIGKLFGAKIIYIETYANITNKTLAGRIIHPIANKFIVQWESMTKLYKNSSNFGGIF